MIHRFPTRAAVCLLALAGPAGALTLDFPQDAAETGARIESPTTYRMPVGPYAGDAVETRLIEGALDQRAWRFEAPGRTTLDLLIPLRDQLTAAGFTLLYECEAVRCGGFDFRFATDVLPEPEMHVDLGDFRYLAATRSTDAGPEYISLIVSRAVDQGFVQVTQMARAAVALPAPDAVPGAGTGAGGAGGAAGAAGAPLPDAGLVAGAAADPVAAAAPAMPVDGGTLAARLTLGGAQVLDDLVFASGSAVLSEGAFASLTELAAFLRDTPQARVMLVGHTDLSGDLTANIALSRERARSVRQRLLGQFDIPPRQIEAEGVGYLTPRASNGTEAGRLANRRVEVMLLDAGTD